MNKKESIKKCKYDSGRFRLRKESDYAIVDELGEYPPIMILMDGDRDCEGQYMDRASVLHLLNELADTNPEEHKYYYIQRILERVQSENYGLRKELNYLKDLISDAIENQKADISKKVLRQVIEDYNEWMLGHK